MNKDTTEKTSIPVPHDPLGLRSLENAVSRLVALKEETPESGRSRMALCIDQLQTAMKGMLLKHEMLKDRYALLKRSNAQLADEVSWLRDQFDDLGGDVDDNPVSSNGGSTRRYTDRWPG